MNSSQLESERLTVSHEIIDRKKLIRRLILLRFSLSFLSFSRCRLDATGRIRKGKEILASNARRYAKSRESPVTSALLGLPLSASSAGGGGGEGNGNSASKVRGVRHIPRWRTHVNADRNAGENIALDELTAVH